MGLGGACCLGLVAFDIKNINVCPCCWYDTSCVLNSGHASDTETLRVSSGPVAAILQRHH